MKDSALRKGHFALYNCLVLGHTKYNGVQRVYCNSFPAKPLYDSHLLDLVMIQPPGMTMVHSWSRQIQFGTHGFCSFSLPPYKPTLGPNRLTVLSARLATAGRVLSMDAICGLSIRGHWDGPVI